MRVYPINFSYPATSRSILSQKPQENTVPNIQPSFRGADLKFGDYVVGAICGAAMAAVGFAFAGPIGAIILGAAGAKTTAEANNETRTK